MRIHSRVSIALILAFIGLFCPSSHAQTAVTLSPSPRIQFFCDGGSTPCAGGKVFTYTSGSSTPLASYADYTGLTPNTNPVILDSNGMAQIWLASGQTYRIVLQDSSGTQQWLVDGVTGPPNLLAPGPIGTTTPNVVEATYFLTSTTLPALTGVIRLASSDQLCWRNNANSADVCISKNTNDQFVIPPIVTYSLDNVVYVDGTHYAQTDVGINAAITSLGGKCGWVYLPPGTYTLAASVTITHSCQHLQGFGIGATVLSYTGTGALSQLIQVGTSNNGSNNLYGVSVRDFTLSGNSHVTDGMFIEGVHRSDFEHLSIINITTAAVHTQFSVVDNFWDIHTSSNEQSFTQQPANCFLLDGPSSSFETTDPNIQSPICEGVSDSGIKLNYSYGAIVTSGTSEGNNRGVEITANGARTDITGLDMESNTVDDVLTNGTQTEVHNITSLGSGTNGLHVGATGNGLYIFGGTLNGKSVTITSGGSGVIYYDTNISQSGTSANMVCDSCIQAITSKTQYGSNTANAAASGLVRLANTDTVKWRNAGNSADLALNPDSSNYLAFGGTRIYTNNGILTGGSCTTANTAFATCTSSVSLTKTEPDTNYIVSCEGVTPTGNPWIPFVAKGTSAVTVTISNLSGAAATVSSFSEIDCNLTR